MLINVLVFGAGYRPHGDRRCSATTLRRRRDEWIDARDHGPVGSRFSGCSCRPRRGPAGGVPYVWGGTTRRGFDCSGLTQYIFARLGHRIPRTAQAQYNASIHLRRGMQRPGDLVFFFSGGRVFHVAIYAGNGWIYAAPHTGARVKRERIWSSNIRFGRVR